MLYKTVFTIIIALLGVEAMGQALTGTIKDKKSQEAIPYANIWIKGTTTGTMSDMNGMFLLKLSPKDTLCVSSVGYERIEIPAKHITENPLIVYLSEETLQLGEVTVRPEISRAKVLFQKIQERKKENRQNIENVDAYKTYKRTAVYLAIDSTSRINRFIPNMEEITVQVDSMNIRFSPIYLAEEGSNCQNKDDSIVYRRVDGIFPKLNQTIESMILLHAVVDLDFYKDQINILYRGIVSPLSNNAMAQYNFYLNDSTNINGKKYYSFSFSPKNKYNPLFTGRFTVQDSTFALTDIYAYIQKEANINFLNGFRAKVSYLNNDKDEWFYDEQEISLNLALSLNKDTVSRYGSQRINEVSKGNWLVTKNTKFSTSAELDEVKPRAWKNRTEFTSKSSFDEGTYLRVSKLKENSFIKSIDGIGGMVLTSYVDLGKFQIGPVFDIYTTNAIEGQRFSIPMRTGPELWERFTVGGLIGYGTRSGEFKYGANFAWQPGETDRFIIRGGYSDDYTLVSQDKYLRFIKKNPNERGNSNFISIFTAREENPYLKGEKSIKLNLEFNTKNDVCIEIEPYWLYSTQTPDVHFFRNNTEYENYSNYGILFNTRFAFGQHYDKYYFARVYYLTQLPVINFSLDIGKTNLPGSIHDDLGIYAQIHASASGMLNMGMINMRYMVNGGYLLGDAPYDLLDLPTGSMSLGYSKYGYNLLHFATFAHNLYTNLHLDWTGGGIVLNHLPVIRKFKLREMVSFKCHYGMLNDSYHPVFDLPEYYTAEMSKPYAEIGFGLTNIFKVLRVEYVRQLGSAYENSGFTDKNGIFFRAEMSF
ncbi:MAG: DUF5686 family protein [Draconibacterium sp.]